MRTLLIGILLMFFINAEAQSQIEINQSSLIGRKWMYISILENIKYCSTLQFTDSTQRKTMIVDSKEVNSIAQYYLSNTIDTEFQSEKVGKNQTGKYIIVEKKVLPTTKQSVPGVHISPQVKFSSTDKIIYEIIEVNNNELKLRDISRKNIIIYKKE